MSQINPTEEPLRKAAEKLRTARSVMRLMFMSPGQAFDVYAGAARLLMDRLEEARTGISNFHADARLAKWSKGNLYERIATVIEGTLPMLVNIEKQANDPTSFARAETDSQVFAAMFGRISTFTQELDDLADELCAAATIPAAYIAPTPGNKPKHNSDFTAVDWYGTPHKFRKGQQIKVVKCLWMEYEQNADFGLSSETIRKRIGAEAGNFSLQHVFRGNPAFGTMIKKISRGVYGLKRP